MAIKGNWHYSEQDMIDALVRVAEVLGRSPSASSRSAGYVHHKLPSEPTSSIIVAHFGGWDAALRAAGLSPNPRNSGPEFGFGARTFTDEQLLEAVREMLKSHPYLTVATYEAEAPKDFPSVALIRRRLRHTIGTWSEIVAYCGGRSGSPKLGS